jgi:hypothetical protein
LVLLRFGRCFMILRYRSKEVVGLYCVFVRPLHCDFMPDGIYALVRT